MKIKIAQTILLTFITLACNKAPAETEANAIEAVSSTTKRECSIPSLENNFDVDSCAKIACQDAGGNYGENGCSCAQGESFVYDNSTGECLEFFKSSSIDRRIKEAHTYHTLSIFTDESLYSTDIYDFDTEEELGIIHFANYVAPNFSTIYYLKDGKNIDKSYVKKAAVLPNIFTKKSFGDISPIYSVRFKSDTELSPVAPYFEELGDYIDSEFYTEGLYYFTDEGCLGHCKKTMTIPNQDYTITRTREFFKGVLALDYITLQERDSKIITVKYDLIGRTILLIDDAAKDSMTVNYSLYSFSMKARGSYTESIVNKEQSLELSNTKKYDWGNVVLCDNGILPNDSRNSKNVNLLRGPFNNSLYGWLTDVSDQSDYFNGIVNLNELASGVAGASSHARAVFNYMSETNVASISLNSCLNDFNNWAPNTFKENFKVVNYSYSDYLDQNSCMSNHAWKEVDENPLSHEMLWVFAAGNEKTYLTPQTAILCPQNIVANKENALIVGSLPEYGGVTNLGRDYVDIFADAPTTSTASAVISSLAANIAKKYPDLEIVQIKKSIMASAKDEGLPARAQGLVVEDLSFLAAKILNENPSINDYQLLKEVHCNGRTLFCSVKSSWTDRFQKEKK